MLGKKDKRVCKTSQSWKRSLHWGIQAEFFLPFSLSSFLSLRTWSLSVNFLFFFFLSGSGSLGVVSGGKKLKDAKLPT